MKRWIRLFTRHPLSMGCYLVGLLISLFTLFDVVSAYSRSFQYEIDSEAFLYTEEALMQVGFSDSSYMELLCNLEVPEGINIKLMPVYSMLDGTTVQPLVTYLITSNAPEKYELESGMLPNVLAGEEQIAVGRFFRTFIDVNDETGQISLDGKTYNVTGIIGCPYSSFQDYYMLVPYRSLSLEEKTKLYETGQVWLWFQSDLLPLQDTLQAVYEQLADADPEIAVQVMAKEKRTYEGQADKEDFQFLAVIYLFCLVLFLMISYYWIHERLREMAIRKAFGQKVCQIIWILVREIICIFAVGIVLYMAIQAGLFWILGYRADFVFIFNKMNLTLVFGYYVFIMAASVLIPAVQVIKVQPAALIGQKG